MTALAAGPAAVAVLLASAGCGSSGSDRLAGPGADVTRPVPGATGRPDGGAAAPAVLVGTVRRADGSPVVGTGVTLRAVADGGPVPEVAVVTDANGRYEVTARLVPGVYEAAAAVDGMFGTATALVQEGEGPARADVVVPSSS